MLFFKTSGGFLNLKINHFYLGKKKKKFYLINYYYFSVMYYVLKKIKENI